MTKGIASRANVKLTFLRSLLFLAQVIRSPSRRPILVYPKSTGETP
jgi:hypothetical protein